MQLDVESMRAFLAVLDWGGMTRAAAQLDLTQSAVSWKIKRLEERVGATLLIRDGQELRPSPAGRILLDEARSIVDAHDRVVHRLKSPEFTGRVRIGSNEEVGAARMAGILGRFKRTYPASSIEFVVNQSRVLIRELASGRVDVAVIQIREDEVESDDVVLWSDELCWATHRDMRFEHGTVPLISYGEHGFYRPVSEPILERHRIEYRHAVTAPSSFSVRAAVEAGLGVAVMVERLIGGEIVEWERGRDLDPLPTALQVVRTPDDAPSTIATTLVDAIVQEFLDLPERRIASSV